MTRVTTWNYSDWRGWLDSKVYADTNGPTYGYTPAGRLAWRTWARTTNTTYTTNMAGDLAVVVYNDGTAGVTNDYDRRGRLQAVTNGAGVIRLTWNDAGGLLLESNAGGLLGGLCLSNDFDGWLRRTNLQVLNNTAVLARTTNNYDAAGRLSVVSDGVFTATYSYLANSALVDHIDFANNGNPVMTTSSTYDYLNRLTGRSSVAAAQSVASCQYGYNAANQ